MENKKNKHKSIRERFAYGYIRKIKKWIFCPNCQQSKMIINKKSVLWECKECGYTLLADEFENDYIFWFCDRCKCYLNNQEGFNIDKAKHICKLCGYENSLTTDNIID